MAGSRDIQRRIKAVGNIGKVTRAMEAVSASKMRRAQAATLASRQYAHLAAEVMSYLRAQPGGGALLHPLLQEHPAGRPAVVMITPNRGLTGGLVLSVIRSTLRAADALSDDVAWIAVGRKGRNFLARYRGGLAAEFDEVPDAPTAADVAPVARIVEDGFLGEQFSSVYVAFADFRGALRQEPVFRRLLPIEVDVEDRLPSAYRFEPSPQAILDVVLPRLLELRLYQALLEAQASEHSARMIAMRNATSAASDLVGELTLTYNKVRQADITSEILDIAGGAEALRRSS